MAVRVARRLGAEHIVGAGRDLERLTALRSSGADEVVKLTEDADATNRALGAAAAEVDIVIDYLWADRPSWQSRRCLPDAQSKPRFNHAVST